LLAKIDRLIWLKMRAFTVTPTRPRVGDDVRSVSRSEPMGGENEGSQVDVGARSKNEAASTKAEAEMRRKQHALEDDVVRECLHCRDRVAASQS